MATVLHRLGRFAAVHHWWVISAWVLVVALAGGSAALLGKPLSSDFDMPGSRFQVVLEDLREQIPAAAGGSGVVVLSSPDGFTSREQEAVVDTLEQWRAVDGVTSVTDPFRTQAELDRTDSDLAAGRDSLSTGATELDAAAAELDTAQAELDAARAEWQTGVDQLTAGRDQLPAAAVQQAEAELDAAERELDAGQTEIDAGREQVSNGRAELVTAEAELSVGERFAALTEGLRFVSQDGTVALVSVQFAAGGGSLDPAVTGQVQQIGTGLDGSGVQVDYSSSITQDLSSLIGPSEAIGFAAAALVLLVMLGTLLAAGLPLLMAVVGVGVGVGGAMALSAVVEMNSATPALALMLGLAVGIDYSLFLLNRHRTQRRQGMPLVESIALANGTSGNAVTFAGLTVIIALAALALTGIPFLTVMGLVAAATVAVSVLVALTLTPALMSLLGDRVLPRRQRAGWTGGARHRATGEEAAAAPARSDHAVAGSHSDPADGTDPDRASTARGWAGLVQRHPLLAVLGVVGVVAVLAIPVPQLRLGLPDGSSEPAGSTAYRAYDTVREAFGAGANGPIIAVASLDQPVGDGELTLMETQAGIAEDLAAVDHVRYVLPAGVSEDRTTLAFQLVPEGGPTEQSTGELLEDLQQRADLGADEGATVDFTGQTVANIDISQQLADALPLYLVVVIGLSLLLLVLVFRSVLVPLLATAGFLLSVAAAFGVVVAVFQLGILGGLFGVNEPGPVLSFLPILLIGVLFGLAMDYQVFLVTAMREAYVHGHDARSAVTAGFGSSARVVTAAAIIMIAVFGGFAFAHLAMVRPIGLGLAIGVLVDAFLIRMTLTPAVLTMLGDRAWWLPRWLDRVLPDVDVEGAGLKRHGVEPERSPVSV